MLSKFTNNVIESVVDEKGYIRKQNYFMDSNNQYATQNLNTAFI